MRIGTRGSALALAQADIVARMLADRGIETSRKIIKTTGDRFTDRPLHEVAGVGAFVRELDDRMVEGFIEIAVHSMKDLPTVRPKELTTSAVLERDSPSDVLMTRDGAKLDDLPKGAVIGTTSMRRRAQLLRYRSDLHIKDLRGNINTRMKKLEDGHYDGILLAEAGLQRMKWELDVERLDTDKFCPSANQGTIAVVTPAGSEAETVTAQLNHTQTRIATEIERIVIKDVEGGCTAPIGSFAQFINNDEVKVLAEVLSLDGTRQVRIEEVIPLEDYRNHALRLGKEIVAMGGKDLVKEAVSKLRINK
ncbi:porphobilinogen deaminase [Methanomethylovorans hollandica DSM 15978]|uniref:Probable porphobilinogen deaminase n=1 Tax=Methanomethylovorans hollandica (strain DSM 15978 / NBRC 107637 / DMS1) TaxID=867904 RepID=L0KYK1_METHD|nr:hydroxymethylbilane synthase [Methanomethylovorans hollandica]AGB49064.1 porphobilinogen deaminase [Methanomethylovorans hollandica DSM 15978]